ncbi:MAG: siderophore-interacting protein [Candidatus Dormibacteria bacterium]
MSVVQHHRSGPPSIPEPRTINLEVVDVSDITRSLRRIVLGGEPLRDFRHLPGQDIMVSLRAESGTTVKRRYSIRRFDPQALTLELNVVRHGNGPGARWSESVATGTVVPDVVAPRGKITVAGAARWHLFLGDETAIPTALNMVEAIGSSAPTGLLLEVGDAADEVVPAPAGLQWVHRQGDPPGEDARLLDAIAEMNLPRGEGHVYIAGEARTALGIRDLLVRRGVSRERMSVKAYWRKDMANLDPGEPQPAE